MSDQQQGPESHCVHKRVSTSKQRDVPSNGKPDVEEESVMRSLMPCVLTIGGLSVFLWLLVYFLFPSGTATHVTAGSSIANKGALKCTPIRDVKELILELNNIQDWLLLGRELKIEQDDLEQWKNDIVEPELRLRAVLRDWYNSNTNHCWEAMWSVLQAIGHEQLAESIAIKYRTES
eukprot:Em0017g589a